ncbi:MAG: hypothetical protein QF408_15860, partial [Pirellulales bacterium]|nr:hypothetical protein [Pirellulales bacterium]
MSSESDNRSAAKTQAAVLAGETEPVQPPEGTFGRSYHRVYPFHLRQTQISHLGEYRFRPSDRGNE